MAARRLRWMLGAELAVYGALGLLVLHRGGTTVLLLALIAGSFFGIRALIVLGSYGFLFSCPPTRGAGDCPPGLPGWLAMMWKEYLAFILLYGFVMPFEKQVMAPDRLHSGSGRAPLLLIHGYQCNRGFWFWLRPRLEAAGWLVATHNLEPTLGEIDGYADGIARRVEAVLAATGAGQVILVCHSMGGLAARAYLRKHGSARVERLVTLGSPHQGTRIAVLAQGRNGAQMRVGNPWLRRLAEFALPPGSVSIYSLDDNVVMPQPTASTLPSVNSIKNVVISGVGHVSMAVSATTLNVLLDALRDHDRRESHG